MSAQTPPSPWKDKPAREAERVEKREAVLRTAARAFASNGVSATSLDDIADQLSITKPALYRYFRSKDEILVECLRRGLAMIDDAVARAAHEQSTGLERLRAALCRYGEIVTMEFGMCVVRVAETDLSPEGRKAFRAHKRKMDGRIRELIREGMRDGSIKDYDVTLVASAVTGALNWIGHWYDPAGPLTPQIVSAGIVDLLIGGIAGFNPPRVDATPRGRSKNVGVRVAGRFPRKRP